MHVEDLVVTMTPHPAEYFGREIELLSPHDEKIALLEKFGVKNLLILRFNSDLASLTGTQFIDDLLVDKLHVAALMMGYNNSIGRKVNGVADMSSTKIPVTRLDRFFVEQSDDISSSSIRKLLAAGNIVMANRYLGYEYSLQGKVVHGFGIGRKLNFPTANIEIECDKKCIPANGVYAVVAEVGGKRYPAMLNIGMRPTFGGEQKTIELHILNFSTNLYDTEVKIYFERKLRDEKKFDTVEDLVDQLHCDKGNVEDYFVKNPLSL